MCHDRSADSLGADVSMGRESVEVYLDRVFHRIRAAAGEGRLSDWGTKDYLALEREGPKVRSGAER